MLLLARYSNAAAVVDTTITTRYWLLLLLQAVPLLLLMLLSSVPATLLKQGMSLIPPLGLQTVLTTSYCRRGLVMVSISSSTLCSSESLSRVSPSTRSILGNRNASERRCAFNGSDAIILHQKIAPTLSSLIWFGRTASDRRSLCHHQGQ
jgi:hypothetical protein